MGNRQPCRPTGQAHFWAPRSPSAKDPAWASLTWSISQVPGPVQKGRGLPGPWGTAAPQEAAPCRGGHSGFRGARAGILRGKPTVGWHWPPSFLGCGPLVAAGTARAGRCRIPGHAAASGNPCQVLTAERFPGWGGLLGPSVFKRIFMGSLRGSMCFKGNLFISDFEVNEKQHSAFILENGFYKSFYSPLLHQRQSTE